MVLVFARMVIDDHMGAQWNIEHVVPSPERKILWTHRLKSDGEIAEILGVDKETNAWLLPWKTAFVNC